MCLVFAMRLGRVWRILRGCARRGSLPRRFYGRAGSTGRIGGWFSGVGLRWGGWLGSPAFALRANCDAGHVAVRRAYVRHDYAFTPLPLPLYLLPDCALALSLSSALFLYLSISTTLIPRRSTSFACFHFVPPSPPPDRDYLSFLPELLTFLSYPLYQRHLQRTFSLRFDFRRTCRNNWEARYFKIYVCTKITNFFRTFKTQIFLTLFLNIKNCKTCSLIIINIHESSF